jgi:hypothetical protein
MSQKPNAKRTTISEMQDQTILKTLFGEAAAVVVTLIKSVERTEVGKKPADGTRKSDLWDVERLDKGDGVVTVGDGNW